MPPQAVTKKYDLTDLGATRIDLSDLGGTLVEETTSPSSSRFALGGGTSLSANPWYNKAIPGTDTSLLDLLNLAPDAGEITGGIASTPAYATGPVTGAAATIGLSGAGRGIGEGFRRGTLDLLRPEWMDAPSIGEEFTAVGKEALTGAAHGALGTGTGLALSKGASIIDRNIYGVPLKEASTKLARALQPGGEERAFIDKIEQGLPDILTASQQTKRKITDAASLESAASYTIRSLDDRIQDFIRPYTKHPQSFVIDGNSFADRAIANIPETMTIERPKVVDAITKQVSGYRYAMPFEKVKTILKEKNKALDAFYKMSPAEQYKNDAQKKFLIDTAVAEAARENLYSRVTSLAGPGMEDLMRRQGAAISIRNLAHTLADTQAAHGSWMAQHFPHIPTKTGAAHSVLRWWESPNQLIKSAFSGVTEKPVYPTPSPRPIKAQLPPPHIGPERQLPAMGETTPIESFATQVPEQMRPIPRGNRGLLGSGQGEASTSTFSYRGNVAGDLPANLRPIVEAMTPEFQAKIGVYRDYLAGLTNEGLAQQLSTTQFGTLAHQLVNEALIRRGVRAATPPPAP